MQTHSLLTLLENKKFTKEFYDLAHKNCYPIIMSGKYDFTKPLDHNAVTGLLNELDPKFLDALSQTSLDDLFDDDIFGFAAQQYLVDLSEDQDHNQEEMFQVKKFLTYHTIYAEAMVGSPYDKVLRMLDGKDPENQNADDNQSSEPVVSKTIFDNIDAKYVDCKFTFKAAKSYQKPKLYKGCKFVKVNDDLSSHYTVDSFNEETIMDDQSIEHVLSDCYPIFITENPSVGDIAATLGPRKSILIGTKDILDLLKSSNIAVNYYTTKFNNRKVETLKVKRFACGTLDKDLSNIPYTVNIVYEDIKVNHNIDAIAKHYNISHDKLTRREVDIIKQIEVALDHPLNVARAESVLIFGPSGSGKTTVAIEYANNKGIPYILQQGHAQLTVDDLLGYKSITDGTYFPSLLRDAVENGKIFIIDEIDACNPNTLLALNSLKNKKFQFADKLVDIHPDFRYISTANTLEYSDVYNGRSKLDKATLARSKHIEYNLEDHHLALRYGLEHIKNIKNIDRLEPREIERLVTEAIIEKELNNVN